jgi:alpha-tubulin suppressor-like RCC1 family protein
VVEQLLGGHDHFCALDGLGGAWCWGMNDLGQVDPTTRTSSVAPPAALDGRGGTRTMGLGGKLSCRVRTDDGTVVCWGDNDAGELGTLDPPDAGPLVVDGLEGVVEIVAGVDHACARTDKGEVLCWGSNLEGQLGDDGSLELDPVPAAVALEAAPLALASGWAHVCAVLDPGDRIVCWGRNTAGQIGADHVDDMHTTPTPVVAELDGPVRTLAAKVDTTCAVTEPGTLWCWGDNASDKIGLGATVADVAVPTTVDIVAEFGGGVVDVALGQRHVCVVTDEARLHCWGADDQEQVGPMAPKPGDQSVEIDLECEH